MSTGLTHLPAKALVYDTTGKQVAERVTALLPRIRVLYMSGYPESVITSQGVVQRGIHLVSKPFVASDLLDHVRATLDA